eukprot:scaffold18902_cov119-Isochrysis_galbana.AAC.5
MFDQVRCVPCSSASAKLLVVRCALCVVRASACIHMFHIHKPLADWPSTEHRAQSARASADATKHCHRESAGASPAPA